MSSRRDFIKTSVFAVTGLSILGVNLTSLKAQAAADMLDENSAPAKNLKYVADNSKMKDKALMLKRQDVEFKDQKCSNCGLFQGKAGDKSGGCPLFAGKQVSANGWCISWNKKA